MNKKNISIIVAVIIVIGFLVFRPSSNSADLNAVEKDRFNVTVEPVKKRDLKEELLLSGSVKALEEATLFPRVEGKLLKNVLKEGDAVKKGETVSLVERDEVGAVYQPSPVPSTINGVVGRVYLDPGANVKKDTPIAFIVNQSKVRIVLQVPERYAGRIYKGAQASFTVEALAGQRFDAVVNVISPVVDNISRSVLVELLADNSKGLLRSGMFAKAGIALEQKKNALSVANTSIYTDDSGKTFVLVPSNGTAARRDVETGFKSGDYTEIVKGLNDGDAVINFAFGLKDGSKISVK